MNDKATKQTARAAKILFVFTAFGLLSQACVVLPGEDGDVLITDDACYANCEARNESCGFGEMDCREICDLWDEMDCTAEVEDYDACRADEEDICGAPQRCDDELDAVFSCVEDYCQENPSSKNPLCAAMES